jgi:hypothetical protein
MYLTATNSGTRTCYSLFDCISLGKKKIQKMETRIKLTLLNAELNPIRHLQSLAVGHHFVDVSRIRVKERTWFSQNKRHYSRIIQKEYIKINVTQSEIFFFEKRYFKTKKPFCLYKRNIYPHIHRLPSRHLVHFATTFFVLIISSKTNGR